MEEYLEMLHDMEGGVKRLLALDAQSETFWDEAAELAPHLTMVGAPVKQYPGGNPPPY
jgi:hypothetical protein